MKNWLKLKSSYFEPVIVRKILASTGRLQRQRKSFSFPVALKIEFLWQRNTISDPVAEPLTFQYDVIDFQKAKKTEGFLLRIPSALIFYFILKFNA